MVKQQICIQIKQTCWKDVSTRLIHADVRITSYNVCYTKLLRALETHDGRSHAVLQPTRKGDPDAPLSDDELEAKFLELSAPVLGNARARALLEALWRLDAAAPGALLQLTDAAL